jgi:hypothetical protein
VWAHPETLPFQFILLPLLLSWSHLVYKLFSSCFGMVPKNFTRFPLQSATNMFSIVSIQDFVENTITNVSNTFGTPFRLIKLRPKSSLLNNCDKIIVQYICDISLALFLTLFKCRCTHQGTVSFRPKNIFRLG